MELFLNTFTIVITGVLLALLMFILLLIRCYYKAKQGTALVRNGVGGTQVSFSGMIVLPVLHGVEELDMRAKRVDFAWRGDEALVCGDSVRTDLKLTFYVRINATSTDVRSAAMFLGAAATFDDEAVAGLFRGRFADATTRVVKSMTFDQIDNERGGFKDEVLKTVGTDLNGYVLDDVAIDHVEQTRT